MSLLAIACSLPLVFLFWTFSATSGSFAPFAQSFPKLYNRRICLLIAHPDDEAMFFAPAVRALTRPELGNHLKILCLSSGNANGLGAVRKQELQKSALTLGLRSEADVFVVDDPARFPDSMTQAWPHDQIASLLASAFAQGQGQGEGQGHGDPPAATIDVLLTFDRHGVSNHPNHRSLYHGAVLFLRHLMRHKPGYACPVALYTLTTTSLLRKYAGVLDAPVTMLLGVLDALFGSSASRGRAGRSKNGTSTRDLPQRLLFVSSVGDWLTAQSAMVKGHRSQMVWFRWGWITVGRYMVVNDLRREG